MIKFNDILSEHPSDVKDIAHDYDNDARPFVYDTESGKLYVGTYRRSHNSSDIKDENGEQFHIMILL
jgi:hypothetical protein